MLVKRNKRNSKIVFTIVFVIIFYYMLRVTTLVSNNGGNWSLDYFTIALNELYRISTPIDISRNNILVSIGVSFFVFMVYETYRLQNKRNIQENTYGSAEWKTPKDIIKKRDFAIYSFVKNGGISLFAYKTMIFQTRSSAFF